MIPQLDPALEALAKLSNESMRRLNEALGIYIEKMPISLTPIRARMVEEGEWLRASKETICEKCGQKYSKHPSLEKNDWLNVLCDGTLVKL